MTPNICVANHIEELKTAGFTIIGQVLDQVQIQTTKSTLESIFVEERAHKSAENRNSQYQVSLCLPTKKKYFRELCQIPSLLNFARNILGDDCNVGTMNGFTTTPQGKKQDLHIDMPAEKGIVAALQMVLCLDDFSAKNGATRLVPYSQRSSPVRADELEHLEKQAVFLQAQAGSCIIYDASLVHAASANTTVDTRMSIHLLYCRSWVKPHWDFYLSMPDSVRSELTAQEMALFGIASHPWVYDPETKRERDLTKSKWQSRISRRLARLLRP